MLNYLTSSYFFRYLHLFWTQWSWSKATSFPGTGNNCFSASFSEIFLFNIEFHLNTSIDGGNTHAKFNWSWWWTSFSSNATSSTSEGCQQKKKCFSLELHCLLLNYFSGNKMCLKISWNWKLFVFGRQSKFTF